MAALNPTQYQSLGLPPITAGSQPDYAGALKATVAQPGAALQSTQTGTAATAASLPGITAKSTVDVNQADQLRQIAGIANQFEKVKGKDGYVAPWDYNQAKKNAAALNITGDAFDNTFADSYTNPNNAYYDTPGAKAVLQVLPQVKDLIATYDKLPLKGQELSTVLKIPYVGDKIGGDSLAYERAKLNLASSIRGIVSAGTGSGFRFNMTELNRIADTLPSVYSSPKDVAATKANLSNAMKNSMGVTLDQAMSSDPTNGHRPDLSSFNN